MRAGDGDYRPTGNRTAVAARPRVPDDLWASFQIPIGLAFFMESTVTACVVAMYPSPAGATERELHFDAWGGWSSSTRCSPASSPTSRD